MKTFLLISLFVLVSCVEGGDGGRGARMSPPTGTLNKQWSEYESGINQEGTSISVKTIDLSSLGNIQFNGVTRITKKNPPVGSKPIVKVYTGDCVLSSTGSVQVTEYFHYFDNVSIVSGDLDVCKDFEGQLYYAHYTTDKVDYDILRISTVWMR